MAGLDLGVVVAILTAAAGLIVALANRHKAGADAGKAISESALLLLKPLNAQLEAQGRRIEVLESEVAILRQRDAELRRGVRLLCGQITALGHVPVWQPADEEG